MLTARLDQAHIPVDDDDGGQGNEKRDERASHGRRGAASAAVGGERKRKKRRRSAVLVESELDEDDGRLEIHNDIRSKKQRTARHGSCDPSTSDAPSHPATTRAGSPRRPADDVGLAGSGSRSRPSPPPSGHVPSTASSPLSLAAPAGGSPPGNAVRPPSPPEISTSGHAPDAPVNAVRPPSPPKTSTSGRAPDSPSPPIASHRGMPIFDLSICDEDKKKLEMEVITSREKFFDAWANLDRARRRSRRYAHQYSIGRRAERPVV